MLPYLVIFALLVLACLWFFWPRADAAEPTAGRRVNDDIDRATLEEAEHEVRQAGDEDSVRDWGPGGPGVQKPPIA